MVRTSAAFSSWKIKSFHVAANERLIALQLELQTVKLRVAVVQLHKFFLSSAFSIWRKQCIAHVRVNNQRIAAKKRFTTLALRGLATCVFMKVAAAFRHWLTRLVKEKEKEHLLKALQKNTREGVLFLLFLGLEAACC
jgi:hypothetical protein